MTADQFIEKAIASGQRDGFKSLGPVERAVWLISDAEVSCDKDGIDSFLARYDKGALQECERAFRAVGAQAIADGLSRIIASGVRVDESLLSDVNTLITDRVGYDYDAIVRYVQPHA